jgi:hypothetical protein
MTNDCSPLVRMEAVRALCTFLLLPNQLASFVEIASSRKSSGEKRGSAPSSPLGTYCFIYAYMIFTYINT